MTSIQMLFIKTKHNLCEIRLIQEIQRYYRKQNFQIIIQSVFIGIDTFIHHILLQQMNELQKLFFYDDPSKRQGWFNLFKDSVWIPEYNVSLKRMRDMSMDQLRAIAKSQLVKVTDFFSDPVNIFTAHEMIGMVSPSTATKFTVHYNLFGGSIVALHTERHKYLFPLLDKLDITGCFCLTELGYGNNAVEMQTTATYDQKTKEFIIDTPTTLSQKYWITNGAIHANYALVFGQTIVKGVNQGVSAFLVPIRDKNLKKLPGVQIIDMGFKMGLNGVDNAALKFHNVRVPRVNMMNRYCDVDQKGVFTSQIKGRQQRFFKVTERLLTGRICIASMTLSGLKTACYSSIKYSQKRLAVSKNGKSETPIWEFQLQQNAIVPLVSRTVVLNLLHNFCKGLFRDAKGYEDEVLSFCCVDKAMIGWHAERATSIMRQRCGGQGFLAANKFGQYIASCHAALTAEGDNRVLMVKVVKDMLVNHFKKGFKLPVFEDLVIVKTEQVLNLNNLLNLLKRRENVVFSGLVEKMAKLKDSGKSQYDILMFYVSDEFQELALVYGERLALQQSIRALQKIQCPKNKALLTLHFQIYALQIICNNHWQFINLGVNSEINVKQILRQLIREAGKQISRIIQNFNIPYHALHTPIASDYVKYNQKPFEGEVIQARL